MTSELRTVPSSAMTAVEYGEVAALCGWIFDCDYRYLMDLCPVRTHVLAYEDGRLIAHALWLDRPLRTGDGSWLNAAYVEGVATHPDYRNRGCGSAVMRRLQAEIAPYNIGALSPAVAEWYKRLGWEEWLGPLFIERDEVLTATPDETVLIYRTPGTGSLDLTASLTAPWRPFEWW